MADPEQAKKFLAEAIALLRQAANHAPQHDARHIRIITAQLARIAQTMK